MERFAVATGIVLLLIVLPALGGEKGEGKEQKRPVFRLFRHFSG